MITSPRICAQFIFRSLLIRYIAAGNLRGNESENVKQIARHGMKYSGCDRPQSTATTTTTTVLARVAPVVVPRYPLGLWQLIEVDQRVSTRGLGPALHIHIEPTTPTGLKKLTPWIAVLFCNSSIIRKRPRFTWFYSYYCKTFRISLLSLP